MYVIKLDNGKYYSGGWVHYAESDDIVKATKFGSFKCAHSLMWELLNDDGGYDVIELAEG